MSRPRIALTIDDGIDPGTTPQILDTLRQHGATATFFIVSDSVHGQSALVERIVREGHEIGHHMTSDEVTVRLPTDELERKFNEAAVTLEPLGKVAWFRPGSAFYDQRMRRLAQQRGYRIALASAIPLDTLIHSPRAVAGYLEWCLQPGAILVLHDVGARGLRTVETLERFLPRMRAHGYSATSLTQLEALATADEAASGG